MNSRTVWRKPRTRSGSEKSIVASCRLGCRNRAEVSAENAIEILGRKACLRDLAQDGAVVVPAVAAGIAVRAVAAVQAARGAQLAQGPVPERLVEIRAGEIDEHVLSPQRVLPERAVEGDAGVGIDELQPREALGQPAEVAAARAGAEVDQHRFAALRVERRHVVEGRDRIAVPEG